MEMLQIAIPREIVQTALATVPNFIGLITYISKYFPKIQNIEFPNMFPKI